MIKYFCDGCEKELQEPYCLYTIGFMLCGSCYEKFVEKYTKNGILKIPPTNTPLELNVTDNKEKRN